MTMTSQQSTSRIASDDERTHRRQNTRYNNITYHVHHSHDEVTTQSHRARTTRKRRLPPRHPSLRSAPSQRSTTGTAALLAALTTTSYFSSSSSRVAATANHPETPFVLRPIDRRHRSLVDDQDDDQQHSCPPDLYGYVPSLQSNCRSFAFCSNGSPAVPTYRCSAGRIFDAPTQTCRPASSSICYPIDTFLNTNEEANANYRRVKEVGPPVYWASAPDGTCVRGDVPGSMHPSKVFGLKAECCVKMLGWVDLGECLGDDFVEGNYVAVVDDDGTVIATTTTPATQATSSTTTTTTANATPLLRTRRPTPSPVPGDASHVGSLTLNFSSAARDPEEPEPEEEALEEANRQEGEQEYDEEALNGSNEADHSSESQQEQVSEEEEEDDPVQDEPPPQSQSQPQSQPQIDDPGTDFIANMVNWANTDLDHVSPGEPLAGYESASATVPSTTNIASTTIAIATTSDSPPQAAMHAALASNAPIYQTTLLAVADGSISSRRHDKNFGTNSAMAVDGGLFSISSSSFSSTTFDGRGEKFDSLLKFDISSISKDDVVVRAAIGLHSMTGCAHGGDVYVTHSDWDEAGLTWDSAPEKATFLGGDANGGASTARSVSSGNAPAAGAEPLASLGPIESGRWYDVDVTSVVSLWRSRHYMAQDFLSVRISSDVDSRCMYASLEFEDDELAPRLVVDYSPGEDGAGGESSALVAQSVGDGGVGDGSVNESAEAEPAPAEISEVILSATMDATLSNLRVNNNFGSHAAFVVDGGDYAVGINSYDFDGERLDSIVAFDTSLLDRSRSIDTALLKLYAMGGCSDGGSIYTTDNTPWDEQRVTWSTAPQVVGQAVADIGRTISGEWYFVDLSAIPAGDWASHDTMTLRIQSSIKDRCMYSSVEYGESTSPKLVINYGPSLTTAPPPPPPQTTEPIVPQAELITDTVEVSPAGDTIPCPATPTVMTPTQDLIPVSGNFLLLVATDDATIDALSTDDDKLGSSPFLSLTQDVATRDIRDILIRFDLTQLHGVEPRSALLTMFPRDDCDSAGTFGTTGGEDTWSEDQVVWSTAPKYESDAPAGVYGGAAIGTFGRVEKGRWYGFTVVNALGDAVRNGKETITFRISAGNLKSCRYASIQSGLPPKLLVAF
ncbi:hypothetical protein ACHAXS_010582 [Conticribra weissflogii]